MALSREQFLSKRPRVVEFEIPAWGESVFIKILSVSEREGLTEKYTSPEWANRIVMTDFVTQTVCDANGNRLFTASDVDAIKEQDADVIRSIYDKAMSVNSFGPKAVDDSKNGSPPTP